MQTSWIPLRQIKFVTIAVCVLTLFFVLFFNLSKHNPLLLPANVFDEDPYDAVGSLGIQLACVAALLSLIRIFRTGSSDSSPDHLGLILRGDLVALLAILVTLAADGVALLRYLSIWTVLPGGLPLFALTLGLFALSFLLGWMVIRLGSTLQLTSGPRSVSLPAFFCLAAIIILAIYPGAIRESVGGSILTALVGIAILFAICAVLAIWIFPPDEQPNDDFLDDLHCFYQQAKAHAGPLSFIFRWVESVAALPPTRFLSRLLNPRRHIWDIILLIALLVGMGLMIAESFAEDLPSLQTFLLVLSVLIGLEAAGVALGYVLFNQYLRIFRTK